MSIAYNIQGLVVIHKYPPTATNHIRKFPVFYRTGLGIVSRGFKIAVYP